MKRYLAFGATIGTLLCAGGDEAYAQAGMDRGAPRFEVGVYGGGSWTSDWFTSRNVTVRDGTTTDQGGETSFGIGLNPAFGAHVTMWPHSRLGVRVHGAYIPSDIPRAEAGDRPSFFAGSPRTLNNWLYDLNLVFRPWATGMNEPSTMFGSTYVFVGGGGFTANVAGREAPSGPSCEPTLLARGACLPYDARKATVGQGTAGIGFDLIPLGSGLGLFAELAGHGYSPPVHTSDGWIDRVTVPSGATVAIADKKFAVTTRFVAGVKVAIGDRAPAPAVLPVPMPPPAPTPAPAPPATREMMICVVEDGQLRTVTTTFNPATSDTMVAGQRFAARYPTTAPTYASAAAWFVQSDQMRFENRDYVRFGVTRIVSAPQLRRVGEHMGTPVFAEMGETQPHAVLYIPVRPGCEFQPYQLRTTIQPRG
jgi:hypothetical protein